METIFHTLLKAERRKAELETRLAEAQLAIQREIHQCQQEIDSLWAGIESEMAETGEYEIIIPGEDMNFKIYRPAPKMSVKCDPEAVPDEFVKLERKPKLNEIREYLKHNTVNWAALVPGETKLQWKAIKKGH